MKPTLVTGASGHVGSNLCRLLAQRGDRVRAMIRFSADPALLSDLDVEVVRGDILDKASTSAAIAGCGAVYHAAAGFLMWSADPERDIIRPSVEGTRNVLLAAARAGVEKVLYVSTSATIGVATSPGVALDEAHRNTDPHTHYFRGKIAAEDEAMAISAREKLPVTAVNPALILGPRFARPSESVRQVADFVNVSLPMYIEGAFDVVDVEDIARGSMLAMEKGGDRERYLLSGERVSVKELLTLTAEMAGLTPPRFKVPVPVMRVLAHGMEIGARLRGRRPMLDRAQVDEFGGRYACYDCGKAQRDLGYSYRTARDTVRRTVAWLLDRGFVPESRRSALSPHPSLIGCY